MEFKNFLSIMFVILMCFLYSSEAYKFYVGGRDGWVLNPSENFNHWAERNRFQVNDTLVFKYKKGSDSVFVVSKEDYDKCNREKPIKSLEDGDSMFKLDRSGPFFLISGNAGNCEKGQKLIVVVLAVRHKISRPPHMSPSSPSPSPMAITATPTGSPSDIQAPVPVPAPSSSPAFTSSFAMVSGVSLLVTRVLVVSF